MLPQNTNSQLFFRREKKWVFRLDENAFAECWIGPRSTKWTFENAFEKWKMWKTQGFEHFSFNMAETSWRQLQGGESADSLDWNEQKHVQGLLRGPPTRRKQETDESKCKSHDGKKQNHVKCSVESVESGVSSVECRVRSGTCSVSSVACQVQSVECKACIKCGVSSVECRVQSV